MDMDNSSYSISAVPCHVFDVINHAAEKDHIQNEIRIIIKKLQPLSFECFLIQPR